MREGYKRTEIGVIPDDWNINNIGKCAEVTKLAGFEFTEYIEYKDEGEIIALRALNLKKGKLDLNDIKRIDKHISESLQRSKLFKGDMLFSYVGTVGEVALIEENDKYHLAPNVAKIKFNDRIIPMFAKQYFTSSKIENEIRKYVTTTSQPALSMENIRKMKMIIPPLKEQKKIAEILSTVDLQIDDTEKLIEKSKELKKGLMQKLLTKGIGHSEFKKTEVGEIPVSWEVCEIGEKANVKSSKRVYKSDYIEQGIPFYRSKEIIELSKNMEPTVELYIDELKYNEFKSKFGAPQKGDLLITSVGSVGNTWVSDGRAFYYKDGNLTQIDSNENINTKFLSYLFESDYLRRQYLGQSNGSAQVALTIEKLKKLVIALPSIDEQNTIVTILLSVDNEIEEHQNKKQKLEELKKGLMQQLLTGKIRVVK